MKKLLPLLLVISAVLVSGCGDTISQPNGDETGAANGLIISSFSTDSSSITAGDTIEVMLEIEK